MTETQLPSWLAFIEKRDRKSQALKRVVGVLAYVLSVFLLYDAVLLFDIGIMFKIAIFVVCFVLCFSLVLLNTGDGVRYEREIWIGRAVLFPISVISGIYAVEAAGAATGSVFSGIEARVELADIASPLNRGMLQGLILPCVYIYFFLLALWKAYFPEIASETWDPNAGYVPLGKFECDYIKGSQADALAKLSNRRERRDSADAQ